MRNSHAGYGFPKKGTAHSMAAIRRHWRMIGLQIGLLTLIVVTIIGSLTFWGDRPASAQLSGDAPGMDVQVYQLTQDLRQHLSLTNQDLAAMGSDEAQATALLTDLRGWVERNQDQIEARRQAVRQAKQELRDTQRSIRVGPRNEAEIASVPRLQQDVADAVAAESSLMDGPTATIGSRLTAAQRSVWSTARENASLPTRYRYVSGIDAAQLAQIRAALSARGGDAQRSRYSNADATLTTGQRQAMRSAHEQQQLRLGDVRRAEQEVLPLPVELRDDDDALTEGIE